MFVLVCVLAVCAVLALFATVVGWALNRPGTGRRRAGAPCWADTSPMPAEALPRYTWPTPPPEPQDWTEDCDEPDGETTQRVDMRAAAAHRDLTPHLRAVHTPIPFDDPETTLNLPRPRLPATAWQTAEPRERITWTASEAPTQTLPAVADTGGSRTGETHVPEGARA